MVKRVLGSKTDVDPATRLNSASQPASRFKAGRSFESDTTVSVVVFTQYVPRFSLVSGTTGHSQVLQLTVPFAVAVRRNTVDPSSAVPRTVNDVVSTLPDAALAGGR
jgi:hypothetical protein